MKKFINLFLSLTMVLAATPAYPQAIPPAVEQLLEKNYAVNGGFENGIAGWKTYKDAAGVLPVDGTLGSPAATITASTSTPLAGKSSGILTHTAANLQGEGVSMDFVLEPKAQGKVVSLTSVYRVNSGTYSGGTSSTDSDVEVYIYNKDTSTIIQPAGYKLDGGVTGYNYNVAATFQSDTTSTNYRLILHFPNTTATAFSLKFDDWKISVNPKPQGAVLTDWIPYTPSITGVGTATGVAFWWKREGDSLAIKGFFTTGTPTGASVTMTLPNGLAVDPSKFSSVQLVGDSWRNLATASTRKRFKLYSAAAGPTVLVWASDDYTTAAGPTAGIAGTTAFAASEGQYVEAFNIPIAGWSSTVQTSDQTDTRIVNFVGYPSINQAVTANVTNINLTTIKDSHGAFSGATYAVPVAGDYQFSVTAPWTTTATTAVLVYVNGVSRAVVAYGVSSSYSIGSTVVTGLKSGDLITFRSNNTLTTSADTAAYFTITRISGPSQIAATESVNARYTTAAGQSLASGGAVIVWGTKDYDSHSGMNTSTGVYTAQISGKYQVCAQTLWASSSITAGASRTLTLLKNGSNAGYIGLSYPLAAVTQFFNSGGCGDVNVLAGDTISVSGNANEATARSLLADANGNWITIKRVGN